MPLETTHISDENSEVKLYILRKVILELEEYISNQARINPHLRGQIHTMATYLQGGYENGLWRAEAEAKAKIAIKKMQEGTSMNNLLLVIDFYPENLWLPANAERETADYTKSLTQNIKAYIPGIEVEWIFSEGKGIDTYDVYGEPTPAQAQKIRDCMNANIALPCDRLKRLPCSNCKCPTEPMDPATVLPCGCRLCMTCLDRGRSEPDQHSWACAKILGGIDG